MGSDDKLKDTISELQLEYEELEQRFWILAGILVGVIFQMFFHSIIIAVVIGVTLYLFCWKYLAKKPFTSAIQD